MCPGIRPATGWIAYLTSTPLRLEQLGQLADGVLGLGHGEAVARDDDHRLRVGQLDRDVVGADLADGAAGAGGRAGRLVAATEPADHDVHDRAVHGVGHQLGQDRAGRADEGAGDDEDRVAEHEAGHRRRRAGERVEQADDDRHVGAADRQDHRDPEDQAGQHDDERGAPSAASLPRARTPAAPRISATVPSTATSAMRDRDELAARDVDRLARDQALELAAGDERAGERDRADERAEDDEDRRVERRPGAEPDEVVDGDEGRRAAADRIEQRHQLRHRGHLHGPRRVQAGAAADQEADDDDGQRRRAQAAFTGDRGRRASRRRRRPCRPR